MGPLIFLLKLGWECRYRLPLLITVGFMVLDIRMQLDINVQTRRIPRPRPQNRVFPENNVNEPANNASESHDYLSDDSWTTFEEQDMSGEE